MCRQNQTFEYIWNHYGRTTWNTQTRKYMPTVGNIDTSDVIMIAHFTGAIWHHRAKINTKTNWHAFLCRTILAIDEITLYLKF